MQRKQQTSARLPLGFCLLQHLHSNPPFSAWRILSPPLQTHHLSDGSAAPPPEGLPDLMFLRPLSRQHPHQDLAQHWVLWLSPDGAGQKGTPPWACTVWTPSKEAARLARMLTCQCLVTAFHTPMRPVWLVAMSWFPTKNKASTGTPRWKTPAESKEHSAGTPHHEGEGKGQEEFRGPEDSVGPWNLYRIENSSRNYRGLHRPDS